MTDKKEKMIVELVEALSDIEIKKTVFLGNVYYRTCCYREEEFIEKRAKALSNAAKMGYK